jgi:hypothetical protein
MSPGILCAGGEEGHDACQVSFYQKQKKQAQKYVQNIAKVNIPE